MRLVEAFDSLAGHPVVMFGGKGGVGKTTLSSMAALHYAKSRPVVLFSTDPASNLNDLLAAPPFPVESLDAPALYDRFLGLNLESLLEIGDRGTYLDRPELRRFFELSLPGVDELMAWMRIGELSEENPGAMIIVDTAPTGHTLRMLGAGEHFLRFGQALHALQAKHRELVRQFTRRQSRDSIDEYIERFEENARKRRALPTTFVPVFLSEPWVVEQTLRLMADVQAEGIRVPFAILNRAVGEIQCDLDRRRRQRDDEARLRMASVIDAPRACFPLDSAAALQAHLAGRMLDPDPPMAATLSTLTGCDLRPAGMVFFAGKGGVGKTTCAASVAIQLARRHPMRRYTVISVDPAHALTDVFSRENPPANLAVEIIDTRQRWQRFRETVGEQIERAAQAVTPVQMSVAYDWEAVRRLVDLAPPGADELFAVSRLSELATDPSQELVIVDTAPTGHFLRLLELPSTAGQWLREFMRILLRYRDLVRPGSLGQELVGASRALHALEQTLRSDRAAVVVVTRPEPVVVAETVRLLHILEQRRLRLACVIANYLTPENDCPCDRSLRSHEVAALGPLLRQDSSSGSPSLLVVERRESPVTSLDELAALFDVASD